MGIELSALEARVVGALIEKEVTTPEVYPMTLNAVMTASNQKSNREPVMALSESDVRGTLDVLQSKHLVMRLAGSRSVKYKQRLCNTEFSAYQFSDQERAIICLLLLRGPQTPGELRSRSGRLASFQDVSAVDAVLTGLEGHEKGPLVQALPREPGKREIRYCCLLLAETPQPGSAVSSIVSGAINSAPAGAVTNQPAADTVATSATENSDRLTALEDRVAKLEEQLRQLME